MAKTAKAEDTRQAYIAIDILENRDGTLRFMPGSEVKMTDAQALPLLIKGGVIEPAAGTVPPEIPAPITAVVEEGQSAELTPDDEIVTEGK